MCSRSRSLCGGLSIDWARWESTSDTKTALRRTRNVKTGHWHNEALSHWVKEAFWNIDRCRRRRRLRKEGARDDTEMVDDERDGRWTITDGRWESVHCALCTVQLNADTILKQSKMIFCHRLIIFIFSFTHFIFSSFSLQFQYDT